MSSSLYNLSNRFRHIKYVPFPVLSVGPEDLQSRVRESGKMGRRESHVFIVLMSLVFFYSGDLNRWGHSLKIDPDSFPFT